MDAGKINLFTQPINTSSYEGASVQPISQPLKETVGLKALGEESFKTAVSGFSEKTNPFSQGSLSLSGANKNYQVGLSPLQTGALGEDALYTQGGRLGSEMNFIA